MNETTKTNLKKCFGITKLISDSGLRKVLDNVSWRHLRLYFLQHFQDLKRLGIIQNFSYLQGHTLVSIDGVEYFHSQKVHCPNCLKKTFRNGLTHYSHSMLCAALVHPKAREVFILGAEPIVKQDGHGKNDCERNASKRLLDWFAHHFKGEKLLFLQDALYGTAQHIGQIAANHWDFIISAKPGSHENLFQSFEHRLATGKSLQTWQINNEGKSYVFYYMNNQPLNGSHTDTKVNFLYCKEEDQHGKVQIFSWITSLKSHKKMFYPSWGLAGVGGK